VNDLSWPLMFSGKYELARQQNRKALELDPSFTHAQLKLGWVDIQEGKFGEAIPEIAKGWAMDRTRIIGADLGYIYASAGDRAKAEAMLAELN
jgi:Flp pilus assembly protein TadD